MLSFKLALIYAPKSKSWNFECPLIGTHQDIIVNLNQQTVGNGVLYDPSAKQSNSHDMTLFKSANFSKDNILETKDEVPPSEQASGHGCTRIQNMSQHLASDNDQLIRDYLSSIKTVFPKYPEFLKVSKPTTPLPMFPWFEEDQPGLLQPMQIIYQHLIKKQYFK